MTQFSDDELLAGLKHVLTRLVDRGLWDTGESISTLRSRLKFIDPNIIHESANAEDLKETLIALPESGWNDLVDRFPLEKTFPDARP